jgi:hypothetical protein
MGADGAPKDGEEQEKYFYPGPIRGRRASKEVDAEAPPVVLRTLCSMPPTEAHLLCERLESHGVVCDISASQSSDQSATVVVREEDLTLAKEILARPAERDDRDAPETQSELDDFYDRQWRCPTCREQSLKLIPLSERMAWFRFFCVLGIASPLLEPFLRWLIPLPGFLDAMDHLPVWIGYLWLLPILGLLVSLVIARPKYCPKCGWRKGIDQMQQ